MLTHLAAGTRGQLKWTASIVFSGSEQQLYQSDHGRVVLMISPVEQTPELAPPYHIYGMGTPASIPTPPPQYAPAVLDLPDSKHAVVDLVANPVCTHTVERTMVLAETRECATATTLRPGWSSRSACTSVDAHVVEDEDLEVTSHTEDADGSGLTGSDTDELTLRDFLSNVDNGTDVASDSASESPDLESLTFDEESNSVTTCSTIGSTHIRHV